MLWWTPRRAGEKTRNMHRKIPFALAAVRAGCVNGKEVMRTHKNYDEQAEGRESGPARAAMKGDTFGDVSPPSLAVPTGTNHPTTRQEVIKIQVGYQSHTRPRTARSIKTTER